MISALIAWLKKPLGHLGSRGLLLGGFVALALAARGDEFDTLRLSWWNSLVGSNLSSATLAARDAAANSHWSTLNTNVGRAWLWSDASSTNDSSDITTCYSRLVAMALAWATPGCALQGNAALAGDIMDALDWMHLNRYTPTATEYDNWWDWEIGAPQRLNNTVVLMYPVLSPVQLSNYHAAVDHFNPGPKGWMTGANRADKVLVMTIRGITGKDAAVLTTAQTNLSPVFPYVTSGDGFYTDGSFIQHDDLPYTGTYGVVLLRNVAGLVNLLAGSPWQITDPALSHVFDWVYDSFQPLIYNGAMMDMVRGRAISRAGETEYNNGAAAINAVKQVAWFAPPADAAAFNAWAAAPSLPPGQFHFPAMDRVVALRAGFALGLSMSSSRIARYESINGENLRGWFTGDGMTYLYTEPVDTQFTDDFWATVDPYHLPGTTVDTTTRTAASGQGGTTGQHWVGGAALSNQWGVAGMALDAYASSLVARKSWFMLDNEIVCLGAGITGGSAAPVHTTVENRRLGVPATASFHVNGTVIPPTMGWSSNLTSASWCALEGVGGYYFPGGATNLRAAFQVCTGSWSQINTSGSPTVLSNQYLQLWFNHGASPANATYAYVLLLDRTPAAVAAYAAAPESQVLDNTASVQAIAKPSLGLTAANFWSPGSTANSLITVDKPASVLIRETTSNVEVALCDPTQTNAGAITLTLEQEADQLLTADPAITVVQLAPRIIVTVNVAGTRGRTLHATFRQAGAHLVWDTASGTPGAQDGGGFWLANTAAWWNGLSNAAWNSAQPVRGVFGAGGVAGNVTVLNGFTLTHLAFAPVAAGAYTLGGGGPLTLQSGILAGHSATLNVPLLLDADQTWQASSNCTLTVAGTVSAPAPIPLSLTGAGTVSLTGGARLNTNTISGLSFVGGAATNHLALAVTQSVGGLSLHDGVTARVTGAGTLRVDGPADLRVGGVASGTAQVLDCSGLSAFESVTPTGVFAVGGRGNGVTSSGTVVLAATNRILARQCLVQSITGSTTAQSAGHLVLGRQNVIHADLLSVGMTRDPGSITFVPGVTNPALVVRASDGIGRVDWRVGSRSSSYFTNVTARVDLAAGVVGASTLDAMVGTLQIGNETYCLLTNHVLDATFVMSGGLLDAQTLNLGLKSSTNSQSRGVVNATFTQHGGLVKAGTLTLGTVTTGNSGALNAAYHLHGGTLAAQLIQPGANAASRVLHWHHGSISPLDEADLTLAAGFSVNLYPAGTHTFNIGGGRSGIVHSALDESAPGAGLIKSGAGTLTLTAHNGYTGPTQVEDGAVLVHGTLGSGAVTVHALGTLGGTGMVNGTVAVSGVLSPGANTVGSFTTGAQVWNSGGALVFNLAHATNSAGWDAVNLNGTLEVQAATNDPFTIRLVTLTGSHTPGPMEGFDPSSPSVWPVAVTSAGILNFDPARFVVDASGFSNALAGDFVVETHANTLVVRYQPTPWEPPVVTGRGGVGGTDFVLSFTGTTGGHYRVEFVPDLPASGPWQVVTDILSLATSPMTLTWPMTNQQGYFRVGLVP